MAMARRLFMALVNKPTSAGLPRSRIYDESLNSQSRSSEQLHDGRVTSKTEGNVRHSTTALQPSWRPATLQPAVLLAVVLFTTALIIVISILRHYTAADNGFAFAAPGESSFSSFTTFAYLYFPTILAVFFSMLWNWVDLDVKRLEPFFQMSSPEGSSFTDALLLQYPFDYVALVPLQAARRRHWSVLISGSITVFIFWAITPLQNSMISTREVSRVLDTTGNAVTDMTAVNQRLPDLDLSLLQNGWATLWYNQTLPPFTTNTSAFAPFRPTEKVPVSLEDPNITGDSSRFWTSFDCHNAKLIDISGNASHLGPLWAEAQDGCRVGLDVFDPPQLYCGKEGKNVGKGNCGFRQFGRGCENTNNTILVGLANSGWTNASDPGASAKFCRMQYWRQPGRLTVNLQDFSFQSFDPSAHASLLSPNELDTSEFEAILATGTNKHGDRFGTIQSLRYWTGNATSTNSLSQWTHYSSENHTITNKNKPTFSFMYGLTNSGTGAVTSNADQMALGFEETHQFLFALAMSEVLSTVSFNDAVLTLQIATKGTAVTLVDPLGLIVQIFLGLITLLALLLLVRTIKKSTRLDANPDSLAQISTLLEPGSSTAGALSSYHRSLGLNGANLRNFRISSDDMGVPRISAKDQEVAHFGRPFQKDETDSFAPRERLPFHLSPPCAILFICALCSIIGLLATLQRFSSEHNGIPLPSSNPIVQQLVLNYVPIAVATFIEPLWTLLNRSMCLLQPFIELKTLKASSKQSLETRYSSLPPQLVLGRALKRQHYLLAGVCLVSISSNILAVTLGALFVVQKVDHQRNTPVLALHEPLFNNTASVGVSGLEPGLNITSDDQFFDHFYVAQANTTSATDLPPWTTKEFFFDPRNVSCDSAESCDLMARGFGVRVDCSDLGPRISTGEVTAIMEPGTPDKYSPTAYTVGVKGIFDIGNDLLDCTTVSANPTESAVYSTVNGTAAIENVQVLLNVPLANATTFDGKRPRLGFPCSRMFTVSYSRTSNAKVVTYGDGSAFGDPNISASASPAQPTGSFGGNGPCHSGDCRNQRRASNATTSLIANGTHPLNITSQTHLVCRTYMVTGQFMIKVDQQHKIQSFTNVSEVTEDTTRFFKNSEDYNALINRVNQVLTPNPGRLTGPTNRALWHNTTSAQQWLPYLMMMASKNSSSVNPDLPAPSAESLIPMVSNSSALLGSIILSLYQEQLFPFKPQSNGTSNDLNANPGQATYIVTEDRVFLDPTMYIMTMTILSVHVVAAFTFYFSIPRDVLSRLPTTLADQLGFFEGSSLIEDREWQPEWKYGYGKFVGMDGKPRIGIEKVPFVQPLNINRKQPWWHFWK